jgi:wyosine [tRNA(Phe)-imidazoG37] synthetase (radical SAM superfamily)
MASSSYEGADVDAPAPRWRVERAPLGYWVLGDGLTIWEATLDEAVERREELEWPGWRYAPLPPPPGLPSTPFAGVVYGPLASRRLGRSLGVNLLPAGRRVCSFACAYCEFSREPERGSRARWPTPDDVAAALGEALSRVGPIDSITISGHGEPTLHPRFDAAVSAILGEAQRAGPQTPVRILTNGSRAVLAHVRRALDRLDERIVKLDADAERVNRPARDAPLGALLHALSLLRDVTLQSCFVDGAISNVGGGAVREWADLVAELEPRGVQIYTLDRPAAQADVRPVSAARLEEIAALLRSRTGIEAEVYA